MDLDVWSKSMRNEIKPSHDNHGSHIAKLITPKDIQDARVVHQYPNFFVLAPSLQEREARIALEEMMADTVKLPAVRLKPRRTPMQSEDALNVAQEAAMQEVETIVEGELAEETVRDEEVEDAVQEAEAIIKVVEESVEDESHNGTIESQAIHLKHTAPRSFAMPKEEANPDTSPVEHKETMASRSAPVAFESERSGIFARMRARKIPTWLETILIIGILVAAGAAHAINMFNYPHYDQDEGTYMMYAWAVTRGMLSPYAYGYGHPPLAWIQIAAWTRLTGGFYALGNALNSGRVLMLLYAVGCTLFVYLIARHLGASFVVRLLAVAIFIFSPLSITFQREVLLDNFATFWFLLSLYLILAGQSHLFCIIGAALSFGIALLSKEVIIVLFPVLIYVVWLYTTKFQRKFALAAFTYVVIACGSSFILMALLKNEFFPYSWHLPWDHHPHLSMIDTYLTQVGRGQQQGSIRASWKAWIEGDPLLVLVGFAAPAFNLLTCWWNRKGLFLALFAASFWFLLLRGGVVFTFYIIPLIPIITLNLAIAFSTLTRWISKLLHFELIGVVLALSALLALVPHYIQHDTHPYNVFTLRPTIVQNEAMIWIRANVPRRAVITINSNLFVDLHEPGNQGVGDGAPYPYAQVYWFVAIDPALHDTLLQGNWDRIDYIVVDGEILKDIQTYGGGMEIINIALNHSVLRVEFKGDNNEFVRIYQVLHKQPPPQP
jgi:4-amino-4-deoxy-L-arabinose transferase-like glycosyltransferase